MPRIARLQIASLARRGFGTTCTAQSKNTEWIRGKLWKGEAPGSQDPYTQRPEAADTTNLPDEALQRRRDKTPAALRESRIPLPGRRSEAATEKEVKAADPMYVPATEGAGLEEIGALKTWWDQPGHWGEESEFRGFGSATPVTQREVVEVHLRRAVVEALALQQAGKFAEWSTRRWAAGPREQLDAALGITLEVEGGKARLSQDGGAVVSALMGDESGDGEQITLEEARGMVKQWDPSWKTIPLDDEMKFALRKRLYQLTGTLIPDAKLAAATTIKHVLTLAAKDPKPLKLAETLEKRNAFADVPNVTVHDRRIGAIDKEVAIGRWKVIEEELRRRDLPVKGYGNMRKNKERDWLMGKV